MRAYEVYIEALRAAPEQARALLANVCEESERALLEQPRDSFCLHLWGGALMMLANTAPVAEADRLFELAEARFTSALELVDNWRTSQECAKLRTDRNSALLLRANLHPGSTGKPYLEAVCRDCEGQLGATPGDVFAYCLWASALTQLAIRAPHSEADALYEQALEKSEFALKTAPTLSTATLGLILVRRARLHDGNDRESLLAKAERMFEQARRERPTDVYAISNGAFALFDRARLGHRDRLRQQILERILQVNCLIEDRDRPWPEPHLLHGAKGVLLWTQALCAETGETARLLREACEAFLDAESYCARSSAYNLGCIYALLGEPENCRSWLGASLEPGVLVSLEEMAGEPYLESVRECEWFRRLLQRP